MNEENEFDEFAPWLAIIITLVGGFMRVLLLSNKGLELEETLSVWVANHSVADMLQWIAKVDLNPPLIISCSITGSHSMEIHPIMSACFLHY